MDSISIHVASSACASLMRGSIRTSVRRCASQTWHFSWPCHFLQRGFETLVGSGVYQFWGATAEQVVDDAFCSLQRGFETLVGNGVYQFWGAAAEQVVDDAFLQCSVDSKPQ
jgi:hypothetical protein